MINDEDLIPMGDFDVEAEERKMREEAEVARQKAKTLIDNAVNNGIITPQYGDLLRGMHTSTFNGSETTLTKVQLALAMKDTLQGHEISERLVVYVGSGYDWRLPVALGARDIVMVDSGFEAGSLKDDLIENIRVYESQFKAEDGTSDLRFNVDVGSGPEMITLHLDPSSVADYQPKQPIGFVLEYQGPSLDITRSRLPVVPNIASKLTDDGLIFNNQYSHELLFVPEIGMGVIERDGFRMYQVTDREKMLQASKEEFKLLPPSLGTLREIT